MKILLCAGVALALTTVAALASDQFAGMYGNTLNIKDTDGTTSTVFVNADHTFEQHQGGKTVRGTYTWKDDTHFCASVTDPAPPAGEKNEDCHEITGDHKVGDTWTMDDGDGKPATMSITAGR